MRIKSGFVFLMCLLFSHFGCDSEPYKQGKNLYVFYCENCHMEDGSGLAKLIPALTDDQYLIDNMQLIPCIIKYGMEGEIVVNGIKYDQKMEGFIHLTDAEISNIVNYILFKWAPGEDPMHPDKVAQSLATCPDS